MEYENDASPNIEYYYSNVNYVCIKANRNSGVENYNNQYKNFTRETPQQIWNSRRIRENETRLIEIIQSEEHEENKWRMTKMNRDTKTCRTSSNITFYAK